MSPSADDCGAPLASEHKATQKALEAAERAMLAAVELNAAAQGINETISWLAHALALQLGIDAVRLLEDFERIVEHYATHDRQPPVASMNVRMALRAAVKQRRR